MRHVAIESVQRVVVRTLDRNAEFRRSGATWTREGAAVPPELGGKIETALTLLRNARSERTLGADELGSINLAQYGLDAPELVVTVETGTGEAFTIAFGAANPLGLVRYSRIGRRDAIELLPVYVAEAWAQVSRR
jgi:hypothetical protein